MTDPAATTPTAGPESPGSLTHQSPRSRRRRHLDGLVRVLLLVCVAIALVPLGAIIVVTAYQGADAFGWDFITQNPPLSYRAEGGGYLSAFVGTGYMVGIAALLSVPLGIAAAVFLVEFPDHRLAPPTRFFTDVMTGVPSIFVGVFVYAAVVVDLGLFYGTLPGAIALAILMLPIVVRSAEEVLRLVPQDLRNAAYALGARHWQSTLRVVLPAATPGLVTGSMLAVARAVGETAPLIFTAFGANSVVLALSGTPQDAITLRAFEDARTFLDAANARGWAGALSLMLITLTLTIAARLIARRSRV